MIDLIYQHIALVFDVSVLILLSHNKDSNNHAKTTSP